MDGARLRPLSNYLWGAPAVLRHTFEELVAENARLTRTVADRNGQLRSLGETRQRVDGLREDLHDLLHAKTDELARVATVNAAAMAVLATVEGCDRCEVCSDRAGAVLDLAKEAGL